MGQAGSSSREPLGILLAVAVAVAGIAAMLGFSARLGAALMAALGIRGMLVVAEAALVFPAAVAFLATRGPDWHSALGFDRPGRASIATALALGATLWLASLGLLELQYSFWRPPAAYIETFRQLHEMLRPRNAVDASWSLLAIAIAPAVCEETLIRGTLLPSLRARMPALLAVAISAAVFALIHDVYRMPFTYAVGLALGALRLRTGSLWPSVVAHATLNSLTFGAAPFLDDPTQPLPDPRPLVGLGLLVVGASLTALAWRFLPRGFRMPAASQAAKLG
jgi:membrane protease YdiL (CAAX protease family)